MTSVIQRAIDSIMGKPKAHEPGVKMNRKQRRVAAAMRQKHVTAERLARNRRKARG